MTPIRSWLYIGKYRDTIAPTLLAVNHIGAMLQLAESVKQPDIVSLYLTVEDVEPIPAHLIKQGVEFVREQKRLDKRILIACGAGINRSSAFTTAVLKEEEGLSLFDAFCEVKKRHFDAMPHLPVWESLCEYYQENIPYAELRKLDLNQK